MKHSYYRKYVYVSTLDFIHFMIYNIQSTGSVPLTVVKGTVFFSGMFVKPSMSKVDSTVLISLIQTVALRNLLQMQSLIEYSAVAVFS